MVISETGLCAAMKAAFKKKSTGYKVAARLPKAGKEEIVLSTPEWIAIINRENAPRKVLALIVEHMGDLPAARCHVKRTLLLTHVMDVHTTARVMAAGIIANTSGAVLRKR